MVWGALPPLFRMHFEQQLHFLRTVTIQLYKMQFYVSIIFIQTFLFISEMLVFIYQLWYDFFEHMMDGICMPQEMIYGIARMMHPHSVSSYNQNNDRP